MFRSRVNPQVMFNQSDDHLQIITSRSESIFMIVYEQHDNNGLYKNVVKKMI